MRLADLFWIFLLLVAIQPVIHLKKLEASREKMAAIIEKKRKSRVLNLIFREEVMRLLGFPISRYVKINDSEGLLRAIEATDPGMRLDIVLNVPEGVSILSEEIARAVLKRNGPVAVHVPHYAYSSSSLIALVADELYMTESAVLGPIDREMVLRLANIDVKEEKKKRIKVIEKFTDTKKYFIEDIRSENIDVLDEEREILKMMSLYGQPIKAISSLN